MVSNDDAGARSAVIATVEGIVVLLQALAVPVFLLLFYFDGMVIGKLTPPATFYLAYVVLVVPTDFVLFVVAGLSVLAATLGQFTLYRGFNADSPEYFGIRRRVPYADQVPSVIHKQIGERRLRVATRLFDRFGATALVVTNAIPGVRSLLSIPAGLSGYPAGRFLVFSTIGNGLYLVLLTAVAWGLVDLAATWW
ncbi:membrane-associated protein [Natronolimnobius sp. AArcel1]|uniref:DedA family protein n=1 Tax=Natronolimnobius sp. AArcel1 TaxID=1679093 RepID=UPI0013EDA22A|nr:VTT domain-containing protein [Natronolimnobius sp. AArcel1]NGM68655.1 membrane-associated protein [Natronolimnobius sp. AArcel1]